MPCDTRRKSRFGKLQTFSERADEVRTAVERIAAALSSGRVKAKVGPQGAIAFLGLLDEERDGVTDACAYRRIMATGSSLAKQAIARAETLAGRRIDSAAVGRGVHSHDGGATWHGKG